MCQISGFGSKYNTMNTFGFFSFYFKYEIIFLLPLLRVKVEMSTGKSRERGGGGGRFGDRGGDRGGGSPYGSRGGGGGGARYNDRGDRDGGGSGAAVGARRL